MTWRGQFISEDHPSADGDPAGYFRREFFVRADVAHATLSVTALGIVQTYLNGSRVGDEVLVPGWTTYDKRLMVSVHDVTGFLTGGFNTVGAIVGQGWAAGAFLFSKSIHHYCDRPALWMQLEVEYADGTIDTIATDLSDDPEQTWWVGHGGVRGQNLYDGETYDARLEDPTWATPGYANSEWVPAAGFDWPMETLQYPKTPPVRRMAELEPVAITASPEGTPVIDFGQNIAGWVRLRIHHPEPGQEITVYHAEALTPEGGLERETNRTAQATDHYICRGDSVEEWEPGFTFHGFRYIEVTGWNADIDPGDLRAIAIWSDMDQHGWFESSDPLINRLHDNAIWSMRDNFVSVPTDCPQRDERLGWTGDLAAFIPTATYLYDVEAVVDSWLTDLMIAQASVGNMPRSAPLIDPRPSQPTALWGDSIVHIPWALYQEYGNADVLRRCWPVMRSFVDEVESLLSPEGLWNTGFQYGDWCDPDAPPTEPGEGQTDRYLVAQAFYVHTCRRMVEIATLLGDDDASVRYAALAQRVHEAFLATYVDAEGRVKGETTTGYALSLCFDLLPDDLRSLAGQRLTDITTDRDFTITSGFAGTPYVMDALTMTGHVDVAYQMLFQTRCPSFLYPVTMGATTTWERWDSILPDGSLHRTGMTSLNHYALGAVNDWVHRVVGGLSRLTPGWDRFRIAPTPGGSLTSASTSHVTPHGLAGISWKIESGQLSVQAVVPENSLAEVVLPGQAPWWVGPGEHSWVVSLT